MIKKVESILCKGLDEVTKHAKTILFLVLTVLYAMWIELPSGTRDFAISLSVFMWMYILAKKFWPEHFKPEDKDDWKKRI